MKLSDEKMADFENRMNTWIARQGFLFQLTHGGTGLDGRSRFGAQLARIFIFLLLLTVLAGVSVGGYLVWKVTGKDFPVQLASSIENSLHATDTRATGFERDGRKGSFKEIFAEGGKASFFNALMAQQVQFNMGLAAGLSGEWDAGKITIENLTVSLKAGATTDEQANHIWQQLFQTRENFTYNSYEVRSTNLSWGYTAPATWGSIQKSRLVAKRLPGQWQLTFTGGTLSQGIFRDFRIEKLSLLLTEEGSLVIEDARLSSGEGTLTLDGEMIEVAASPIFKCSGEMTRLPLAAFLPPAVQGYLKGAISGSLTASGSPNLRQGISYEMDIALDDGATIGITDEVPILRMIGALDTRNSYRHLDFNQGSLKITTEGQNLTLSEIDLAATQGPKSLVVARLVGDLEARPSSMKDLSELSENFNQIYENFTDAPDDQKKQAREDFAQETRFSFSDYQYKEGAVGFSIIRKDQEGEELLKNRIEPELRRTFRTPSYLTGDLALSIPVDTFLMTDGIPGLEIPESPEDLATLKLQFDSLLPAATQELTEEWKSALKKR